jgi:glycosyltransferase involved in cell wall biosynthesis
MFMTRSAFLVSVVIPAFNASATIAETIHTVLNQSYKNIEIIVVNDGSSDNTADVVRGLMATHPCIHLLEQANQGVSAARNKGIRAAKGEFIAFIDADDLCHPDKILLQIERFQKGGDRLGVVYTWLAFISQEGNIIPGRSVAETYEGDVYGPLLISNFIGGSTLMVRRNCFETVGLYDTNLRVNEDQKLHLALAAHYDFGVVPRFLFGYRLQTTGLAHDLKSFRVAQDQLRDEVRRQYPNLPGWLFRWSAANNLWNLGLRALRAHRYKEGIPLLLLTMTRDPAFMLQPAFRSFVLNILRRLMKIKQKHSDDREQLHFLDPRAEATIVPSTPSFTRARMKRLASFRLTDRGKWPRTLCYVEALAVLSQCLVK